MKSSLPVILFILLPSIAFSFTDDSHFSKTFDEFRYFRVFTPPGSTPSDTAKRYPVIYYFHGCRGSYKNSGVYTYSTWGLTAPVVVGRPYDEAYEYPNNADFENFTYSNDVIVVSVDGQIEGLGGCGVYFPSLGDSWSGNYYSFSAYTRELIEVVDDRFNTIPEPGYRAISGLSMGGYMAVWIAAANPHLFSSASGFGHSPGYYDVGDPSYQTTIDVKELWRNLRGLPFRHSTNDRDYLRYYTDELYAIYSGGGFQNDYYLADFCRHWAARADLQFDFHMNHFGKQVEIPRCFSYINLYPEFEIRGYNITSSKEGNGWIYLRDVTNNGMGIYTRERFPWGRSLPDAGITLSTPGIYTPGERYTLVRYSYRDDSFTTENLVADPKGRLEFCSAGGAGELTGILGKELQPPLFLLTDTINETLYIEADRETSLSFDVVNLSDSSQTIDFTVTTENDDLLSVITGHKQVTVEPQTRKRVDSFTICRGRYLSPVKNRGYLKISSSINGAVQDREHIIQVKVVKYEAEKPEVMIFDGRSETIPLYKYGWSDWIKGITVTHGTVTEGSGNGNGKAEAGEIFSIWVRPPGAFDPADTNTWHPVVPVINKNNPDISVIDINEHLFSTGRPVLSAQIRLNRVPTEESPVTIPVQSRFVKAEPLEDDCHRNTADNFSYYFYKIIINADGTAGITKENIIQ